MLVDCCRYIRSNYQLTLFPHLPQLFSSVSTSTQALLQHCVPPVHYNRLVRCFLTASKKRRQNKLKVDLQPHHMKHIECYSKVRTILHNTVEWWDHTNRKDNSVSNFESTLEDMKGRTLLTWFVHEPQWRGSVSTLVQAPLQHNWPAPHFQERYISTRILWKLLKITWNVYWWLTVCPHEPQFPGPTGVQTPAQHSWPTIGHYWEKC